MTSEVGNHRGPYVKPEGDDIQQWRENARQTDLYQLGDMTLVWVNECDLDPIAAEQAAAERERELVGLIEEIRDVADVGSDAHRLANAALAKYGEQDDQ